MIKQTQLLIKLQLSELIINYFYIEVITKNLSIIDFMNSSHNFLPVIA
jgi:hypothetical protein